MRRRLGATLGLCAIALWFPQRAGLHAQQPPVFRGGVTLVNVDVYPRRDGKVIEGLTAGDFQIFEDGKPQQVETFEFIRTESNPADSDRRDPHTKEEGDRLAADPHNRVFVIYLDQFHTSLAGARDARRPLLDFLGRSIGPNDLFAVTSADTPPRQLVFGRSIATLEAELTKYVDWGLRDRAISPAGRPAIEAQLSTCMTATAPSLGDALVALNREDTMATHLEELVTRLGVLRDERKNVLLISEGWNPLPAQNELTSLISGSIPQFGAGPGGRLGMNPQRDLQDKTWCDQQIARLSGIDLDRRFKDLLDRAARANVSFYPVDVGGLGGSVTVSQPKCPLVQTAQEQLACDVVRKVFPPSTLTLRVLADNTDGRAVFNTNDLGAGLRRVSDDLSAYYLLGYSSTNQANDGKYRKIDVKVTRPGLSVAARRGYVAPSADAIAASRVAAAASAVPPEIAGELGRLSRLRPDAELFAYAARTGASVSIVAEISSALSGRWGQGGDVRVTIPRAGGEAIIGTGRIEPAARGAAVAIPVPAGGAPGVGKIVVSGASGSLDVSVDVPGAADSLVGDAICYRGTAAPRFPLRPVADFQFRRTERLHVEWAVLTPIDQRAVRLLDRRGQPLPLNVTVTEAPGRETPASVVAADVLLAPLAEGDYLLELTAGAGSRAERRLIAFRVIR